MMRWTESIYSTALWGLASAWALAACEAGDSECVATKSPFAYTDPTITGKTAEQLLDSLAGNFEGTLEWHGGGDEVNVMPSSGSTELSLSLEYQGGKIWFLDREARNLAPNERLVCIDELMIHATLTLETSDGALGGQWPVVATYRIGSDPLVVEIRPFGPDNDGSFSAGLLRPQDWDPGTAEISLFASFDQTGVNGHITMNASRELQASGNVEEGVLLSAKLATWRLSRGG